MKAKQRKVEERSICKGQKFFGASRGKKATWVVTRSIKTSTIQRIYCKVVKGVYQELSYTRKQFRYLLSNEIIELAGGTR